MVSWVSKFGFWGSHTLSYLGNISLVDEEGLTSRRIAGWDVLSCLKRNVQRSPGLGFMDEAESANQ